MCGEHTETPLQIKIVEETNLDQSDGVVEELPAQPSDKDQHQESLFMDDTETELAAEVQEYPQKPPLLYQEGQEQVPDSPTVVYCSMRQNVQTRNPYILSMSSSE